MLALIPFHLHPPDHITPRLQEQQHQQQQPQQQQQSSMNLARTTIIVVSYWQELDIVIVKESLSPVFYKCVQSLVEHAVLDDLFFLNDFEVKT